MQRPMTVMIGVSLLLTTALLGLVGLFMAPVGGLKFSTVVAIALNFALPVFIWGRRNWARIVLLVLFLLGSLGLLLALYVLRRYSISVGGALVRGLLLMQSILPAVALACLFSPSSNAWFRE